MKKYTFLLIVLALITLLEPAMAQRRRAKYKRTVPMWYRSRFYTTVGGGIGSSNYFGDVTPTTSFVSTELKFTRTSLTGFVTHKFTPRITAKASLSWHRLKGDDNVSADPSNFNDYGRYLRNLHFRNDIIELTGVALFDLFQHNEPFFKRPQWVPYAFIGLGVIYSNPKARLPSSDGNGDWVPLRPLRTEGNSYSPVNIVIPAGLGVRYKLSQRIDIGFEVGYRYTFTDYLDDVSGRYIDPSRLNSPEAVTMANRVKERFGADSGESREQALRNIARNFQGRTDADSPSYDPFGPGGIGSPGDGTIRGAGKGNDWYFITNLHVSYILVNVIQRPRFR
jgi:hypothetical protein